MAERFQVTAETGGLPVGCVLAGKSGSCFSPRGGDGDFALQAPEAMQARLALLEGTLAEIREQIDEALGTTTCQRGGESYNTGYGAISREI